MFVTLTVSFSRFAESRRKPDVRSHPSDLVGAENKEHHTSDLWPSRENPVCTLTREGLQTSSPESTFVAWTPPRLTVRTWQDTSEVTTPAAADGAQTHKNAWHNSRLTNDVCSCLTVELPGRCNSFLAFFLQQSWYDRRTKKRQFAPRFWFFCLSQAFP